ncbi:MAG: MiaB/RimO family radical SAM methylthiotransferase [Planctomycetota bacterium]
MPAKTVYLETFGCQMNELDSELVAGQLRAMGYTFTSDRTDADVVLYNTCSVREQAETKVWSRLGEMQKRRAGRPGMVVGVLGCMAERDGAGLMRRMPVVDVMCGPGELDKLPALIDNAVRTRASLGPHESANLAALQGSASRRSSTLAAAGDDLETLDLSRVVSPTDAADAAKKRSAYVRITRGCNKFCTYCVVPFTRGAEIHRPPEHIVDECRRLADAGVIEVTLLGQTINHYRFEHGAAVSVGGVTQPQKGRTYRGSHHRDAFAGERVTTFADLLREIHERVPEIERLRFVTSYPRDFGDDVLEVMRDSPRLCRYLHVPAQSGSDRVLQKMNRGYTVGEYFEFLDRAKSYLDEPEKGRPLMLSGDIIVGFPTETDEDYEGTVRLVERSRYKNCFIFKYSPRPGTVAFDKIEDDVPDAVKRARNNHLLSVQAGISDEIAKEQVGRSFRVFVEGVSKGAMREAGATQKESRNARGGTGTTSLTIAGRTVGAKSADAATTAVLEASGGDTVQMSGRTDGDLIVFFEAPRERAAALTGEMARVRVTEGRGFGVLGELDG